MIVEFIDTDTGNALLATLQSQGWKIKTQYNPFAFDKGIDYDSYELVQGKQSLTLEWDNWCEWRLKGEPSLLNQLVQQFSLNQGQLVR